jgi:hypothetical protein
MDGSYVGVTSFAAKFLSFTNSLAAFSDER